MVEIGRPDLSRLAMTCGMPEPVADGLPGDDPDLRDMWNIPEYAQLLQILQTELNLAYVGRKSPQDALDNAAIAQQALLDSSPDKPA